MPACKRALQELPQPVGKRIRLSDIELEELGKAELITKIRDLEDEVGRLQQQQIAIIAESNAKATSTNTLTDAQAQEKAENAPKVMIKGITKQMTWKPSCKTNSAKFSYSSALHSKQVFDALTNQPPEAKKTKKQLSFTPADFEIDIAKETVRASVRYSHLDLTGKSETMRWNEDDQTFTVSGSYGTG